MRTTAPVFVGAAQPKGGRNSAVDWLRLGTTGAVFLYHTARFFNPDDWHVKSPVLHTGLGLFVDVLEQWIMPLMFILSGVAAALALRRGGLGRFVASKVPRLLVPLLFGVFVLAPPQVYLERLTHGQFAGSFIAFLPHYFDGLYAFGGNFAWMGLHLWYLLVLFLFSVLLAPLMGWLRTDAGARLSGRLASLLAKPGLWLLLALPIAGLDMLDPGSLPGTRQMGGWNLFTYICFYLYGYFAFANPKFQESARRGWRFSLALVLLVPVTFVALGLGQVADPVGKPVFALISLTRGINTMAWVMAITGLCFQYLTAPPLPLALSEAVLPFYMLHQPVLILLGHAILGLGLPPLPSYGLIGLSALTVIIGIYLRIVRPFVPMRFLFGMKSLSRSTGQATES